jgi:hypothetical protein
MCLVGPAVIDGQFAHEGFLLCWPLLLLLLLQAHQLDSWWHRHHTLLADHQDCHRRP